MTNALLLSRRPFLLYSVYMQHTSTPRLSVIMPVFNESYTVRAIVEKVLASALVCQLIIVDDGSTDDTGIVVAELVKQHGSRIVAVAHPQNRGKGAAIRTARCAVAGDVVLIQDADLEYDPRDYQTLLAPILSGEASVVYGSRNLIPGRRGRFFYKTGVRVLTEVSNVLYGTRLTDVNTCYKAFTSDVFRAARLRSDRFEFCVEITAQVAKQGHAIREVPIAYHPRSHQEGKKIKPRDGFTSLWVLIRERFT